jgi:D-alanyl-D-alanine dipeptidase
MGTPFDGFTALVEPRLEAEFLASGALSASQIDNRLLLRKVMTQAGFHVLPIEWWHFDALPSDQVRGRFSLIV